MLMAQTNERFSMKKYTSHAEAILFKFSHGVLSTSSSGNSMIGCGDSESDLRLEVSALSSSAFAKCSSSSKKSNS